MKRKDPPVEEEKAQSKTVPTMIEEKIRPKSEPMMKGDGTDHTALIPRDALSEIFKYFPFKGPNWFHIRLVCKRWNEVGGKTFNPNKVNALLRMVRKKNELAIIKLIEDERVDQRMITIIWAFNQNYLRLFTSLMKRGDDPSLQENVIFRTASENGNMEIVKELLEDKRVNAGARREEAMRMACKNGHLNIVKMLLQDKRRDPSAVENEAIRWACTNGHLEIVNVLLDDERVNPSACYNEAIRWASAHGHLQVVEKLLEDERVDPSAKQNDAIQLAC
eukprot:TRINITY_DN1306_c0_g4_i2.p1 TRINITY_DN1306_c0_g4~~TRINITY_DN1306_c0_g4_i2.p1  ORF type:complete len:277 (-),score=77.03 TRINITY_DN1306_c0_g4_i2:375-1205(-)